MSLERVLFAFGFGLAACAHTAPPAAGRGPTTARATATAQPRAATPAPASSQAPAQGAPSGSAHAHRGWRHRFKDPEKWAKVFDNPSRDKWQKPDAVIKALAPDARVVDIGAGTGYFTVRLARAVPHGKVIAVDIEPAMLKYIDHRARHAGLGNISTVLGSADSPNVEGPIDTALVVDTYHHIEKRPAYFRGLSHELSPDGRVVIVDFRMGKLPVGPPQKHRIPPAQTTREMKQAGYQKCGSFDELPYQYMLEFGLHCRQRRSDGGR